MHLTCLRRHSIMRMCNNFTLIFKDHVINVQRYFLDLLGKFYEAKGRNIYAVEIICMLSSSSVSKSQCLAC